MTWMRLFFRHRLSTPSFILGFCSLCLACTIEVESPIAFVVDAAPAPSINEASNRRDVGRVENRVFDAGVESNQIDAIFSVTDAAFAPSNSNWQSRIRFTLRTAQLSTTVMNVPVFLKIPAEVMGDVGNVNAYKFVGPNNKPLPFIRVSTEPHIFWLLIPRLEPGVDGSPFWLYLADAPSDVAPAELRPEVSFLQPTDLALLQNEISTDASLILDESDHMHHGHIISAQGDPLGELDVRTSLGYGSGVYLDGESKMVIPTLSPPQFSFQEPGNATISFSVKRPSVPTDVDGDAHLFGQHDDDSEANHIRIYINANPMDESKPCDLVSETRFARADDKRAFGCTMVDDWMHFTLVFEGSEVKVWVNGNQEDLGSTVTNLPGLSDYTQQMSFMSGAEGVLDEVHITQDAKSDDWVQMRHRTMIGQWIQFEMREVLGADD